MTKEDKEIKIDVVTSDPNEILPGDILKEARGKMGLSISDVADRLRLRSVIIQQMENNQFDLGKSATFTRGYLRSYAKVVAVSEKEILAALDKIGEAQPEEHEMQSFSRQTKRAKHDRNIMKLTWVILALFIGITMMWWWQNQTQAEDETYVPQIETAENQQALAPISTDTVEPTESVLVEESSDADLIEVNKIEQDVVEPTVSSEDVDNEVVVSDPKTPEVKTVVAETTKNIEQVISMSFSSDCWIDVKDATGTNLSTGVKKSGTSLTLKGVEPFKVVIGAPSAVELTYQGKLVDLTKYPVGRVARLTLQQ
ncbi:MAG: DUF4115 domain-containing protein [Aliivibrio sp.]|uniref:RodZ domain-containing protein n=1 Tax=Aliivibrio sp. TaxID=1872443 RepID=UPI001A4C9752|nr:DUF4115 domain-containing protein [Aliivibrio sp.]